MLIYLADLAHTYSTTNESLMVPLNIGYVKAYAVNEHKNDVNIELFKDPNELLKAFYKKPPDLLGLSNYGWNQDLNYKIGKFIKQEFPKTIIVSGGPNIDEHIDGRTSGLNKETLVTTVVDGNETRIIREVNGNNVHLVLNNDNGYSINLKQGAIEVPEITTHDEVDNNITITQLQ